MIRLLLFALLASFSAVAEPALIPARGCPLSASSCAYTGNVTIGGTLVVTGSATAASFIPSGATIPTNGTYLPAANTLGWAINSAAEVRLTASALSPAVSGGNALGTTSLPWSGLALASGAVIDWAASDLTLTQTTDTLTLLGGGLTIGNASARQYFKHSTFYSPASGVVVPIFYLQGNAFGTITSGGEPWRAFVIDTDTADASLATGGGIAHNRFSGVISAGAVGGRTGLLSVLTTGGTTTLAADRYYVAFGASARTGHSAGGATGAGNARGDTFGANIDAQLLTGAGLFQNSLVGLEVNAKVQTGVAVGYKIGQQIVQWADDAVSGTAFDAALSFANQPNGTAPGWDRLISVGGSNGWFPGKAAGVIMEGVAATIGGGPAMALDSGIKLDAITFTTCSFSSTGFCVNGTGNVTTPGLTLAGLAVLPYLSGTTGTITPGALLAGACGSGTATVTGVTTGMSLAATPVTYPGDGTYWLAYVSGANTVTVKVCVAVAGTPGATAYNVRAIQ